MNVLVTGGSGYLGTHVRRFFGADDFSRRAGFDVCNERDAARVADYDVVIHLAAHLDKSEAAARECFRVNAEGTANLMRQMRAGSVFIYASTKDVYGAHAERFRAVAEDCPTDYAGQTALEWSKFIGEKYVEYYARRRDVRACIFRLSTVYAPVSVGTEPNFVGHYVEAIKHGMALRLAAHGEPVRDLLHVEDFARACRAFVDSPRAFGLYNLGGGQANALSLRALIEKIAALIHAEPILENADAPAPVPFHYVTDLTRVRAELNWQPQIGIEEGLRSLL
jgi:CDP-paratose 2-epimerase